MSITELRAYYNKGKVCRSGTERQRVICGPCYLTWNFIATSGSIYIAQLSY
ncbi:MAG: hypothetical protein ACI906_002435 [Candidatus Latescibacterota bacterium]|jgi:hypothetical protein